MTSQPNPLPITGLLRLAPVLAILAQAALALPYNVDTTTDEYDGSVIDGDVSLRDAIAAANATSADDIITLPAGTFLLTLTGSGEDACATGDLDVIDTTTGGKLTIQGIGAHPSVIDATGLGDRVLHLLDGANVTLEDLTITGGDITGDGGGIYSYDGSLYVTTCTISGNSTTGDGGGIYSNDGSLLVTESTISGNSTTGDGGGIYTEEGSLTVTDSTIDGNSADSGGGIWNFHSNLIIDRSTISGNSANYGAGIDDNSSIMLTINNSTIAGNTATVRGGGILHGFSLARINRCTITANTAPAGEGSGMMISGDSTFTKAEILASIIAGNSHSDIDLAGTLPTYTSLGYNLIGSGNATGAFGETGDITGTTDPVLAPLGNYGGPTRTMRPLAGSPAIDAGGPGGSGNDQRGFPRVAAGTVDIGAVETGPALLVTNTNNDGAGSLRQALLDATDPDQHILFDAAVFPATIGLTSPLLIYGGKSVFVDASNIPGGVTINAQQNSRVLELQDANTSAALHSLSLTGGRASSGSPTSGLGGGIYQDSATLNLTHCSVSGNTAEYLGGGIWNNSGILELNQSSISGNSAKNSGGGILNENGVLEVDQSTISGNSTGADGGGIENVGGILMVTRSTIAGNSASWGGGMVLSGTNTLVDSTIEGNTAIYVGGGVFISDGRTAITRCTISNNTAPEDAGGGVASMGNTTTQTVCRASIIAGNGDPDGDDRDVSLVGSTPTNSFVSADHNLVGSGNATGAFNKPGDTTGTSDPQLAPLGYYGGLTRTMHPLAGSAAIDAGGAANPGGTDQRKLPRFVNGALDIGAIEVGPVLLVTNTDDAGAGSLRQALADATTSGTRIQFGSAVFPATIGLTSELTIDGGRHVFIDASDMWGGVTIDGQQNDRVLSVKDTATTAALHSLTITGGQATGSDNGSGIYNRLATLTVAHSTITGNSAVGTRDGGGLYNWDGVVDVTHSTITGNTTHHNGGGIGNLGTAHLTITHSTISGNTTSSLGGGVYNLAGTLNLNRTDVSGNTSSTYGGGIYNESGQLTLTRSTVSGNEAASGGGIYSHTDFSNLTTITDSTIAENTATVAGGGIYNLAGRTAITRSTIAANTAPEDKGAGVANVGDGSTDTVVQASIIAGNTPNDVDLVISGSNSFTSADYNLIGSGGATGAFTLGGDTIDVSDPQLAPLGNYGGPTRTMHPLAASLAIDAAGTADPGGSDQRGFPRFVNGDLDIGAVETGPARIVTNTNDSGTGSLRQALIATPTYPGDRILFDPSVFPATIGLNSELIMGGGRCQFVDASNIPGGVTINGGQNGRVLRVTYATSIATLHSLTLTGGHSPDNGGGIQNHDATLNVIRSTITGNSTDADGGGIHNDEGTLIVIECDVSGNYCAQDGGGMINDDGDLAVNRSTISGNLSGRDGGGVYSYIDGTGIITSIETSTIAGNAASRHGGGLYNDDGRVEITRCTIAENTAPEGAGSGVASWGGILSAETVVEASIIAGNTRSDVDLVDSTSINSFASGGDNLIGSGDATGAFSQTGDTTGTNDPLLAPLGHYGGSTRTMHPLVGSPVIDARTGTESSLTDQRGFAPVADGDRDSTALADIGAVEAGPALLVFNTNNSGGGSLRQAIADAAIPGQRITFDPSVSTINISGELTIDAGRCLFIDASDITGGVTIDAQDNGRVLVVEDTTTAALHSLTLTGGRTSGSLHGGGIYIHAAALTIGHSTITGNSAVGGRNGGGLYNWDGTVTVARSTISNNYTEGDGGGILNLGAARLTIDESTISGNSADSGGGIYNYTNPLGRAVIANSTVSGNFTSAHGTGGGIYNYQGLTEVTHCTISANTVPDGPGSGIASTGDSDTETVVLASIIAGNSYTEVDMVGGASNSFTSAGHNLIGYGVATGAFNLASDTIEVANPLLAPLDDFGGPTHTMPPAPGSPAIEGAAMGLGTPGTDQRGAPRPAGPLPDIGAVEAFPFWSLPLIDTDWDNIDDRLEGSGGCYPHLDVGTDDSTLDTDGDGHSDAFEIANMTDLYDPNDYFRILSIKPHPSCDPPTNPLFTVTVKTFPGLGYRLDSSQALDGSLPWTPDATFTADDFTEAIDLLLEPGHDFVRAMRQE